MTLPSPNAQTPRALPGLSVAAGRRIGDITARRSASWATRLRNASIRQWARDRANLVIDHGRIRSRREGTYRGAATESD